jgi:hypothetical protein
VDAAEPAAAPRRGELAPRVSGKSLAGIGRPVQEWEPEWKGQFKFSLQ